MFLFKLFESTQFALINWCEIELGDPRFEAKSIRLDGPATGESRLVNLLYFVQDKWPK